MSDRIVNDPFGQRVRTALAVARVERTALARACNVTPQAVQKWCDGTAFPSSRNLLILSQLTGASVEWLMWQSPVDITTTDWAINGVHIKHLVQAALNEIRAEQSDASQTP